jgi:hypothetical protein
MIRDFLAFLYWAFRREPVSRDPYRPRPGTYYW